MVHRLAADDAVDIAQALEPAVREFAVADLGLLQAEDVRLHLGEKLLDDPDPGADRVDVPGCDLEACGHGGGLAGGAVTVDGAAPPDAFRK